MSFLVSYFGVLGFGNWGHRVSSKRVPCLEIIDDLRDLELIGVEFLGLQA